jgi:hypothetical protein
MDLTHTTDKRAYFRCSIPADTWAMIERRGSRDAACRYLREMLSVAARRLAETPGVAEAAGRPSEPRRSLDAQ